MRELKFRAWDKTEKEMVSWEDIKTNLWLYLSGKYTEKYPLMQYTGLKDKNGKEDYHKNILRNTFTGLLVTVEYGEYSCRVGTGYGWYLQKLDGETYIPYPPILDEWEIIGNTYSTPDLLEKGQER